MTLAAGDFPAFFEAVHGRPPFPWQARLAERVAADGRWPEVLALPTAFGKTAVLTVAVFVLALDAPRPAPERRAARRIFFAVDRRVVVDAAHAHGRLLAKRLAEGNGVVAAVARALASVSGGVPLAAHAMRGGMPRDDDWTRDPVTPLVCATTVDQLGSRLLFRGYGVSDGMLPIHAALVGNDSLVILDEAHLSAAFEETLRAVELYRRPPWCGVEPKPFRCMTMTATPRAGADVFGPAADDFAHPELRRRFEAGKTLLLRAHRVGGAVGAERAAHMAPAFVRAALDHLADGRRAVAAVVNTVGLARRVADALRSEAGGRFDVALLTGRSRPLDRDRVLTDLAPRILAGREDRGNRPLVVAATQCIEAGPDFDFDAMVSEACPLDALEQRLGRLDRLGLEGSTSCVLIAGDDAVAAKGAGDPLYGEAVARTWAYLQRHAQRDRLAFGAAERRRAFAADPPPPETRSAGTRAPTLLPAHVDMLARTMPRPAVEPDPAPFLHGVDAADNPDVYLVWRADVPPIRAEADVRATVRALAVLPPSALEAMPVPIHEARRWLRRRDGAEVADVEAVAPGTARAGGGQPVAERVVRWRGLDEAEAVGAGRVRPGDVLVLPAAVGGCDADGCWAPEGRAPVADIAEAAALRQRRERAVRLHPSLPRGPDPDGWGPVLRAAFAEADDPAEGLDAGKLLDVLRAADALPEEAEALLRTPRRRIVRYAEAGVALVARRNAALVHGAEGVNAGKPVPLEAHSRGVAERAARLARLAGFGPDVTETALAAGLWHDAGKAERRTQTMLRGGNAALAWVGPPLAKSGLAPDDATTAAAALAASGLPRGARHECWSVRLFEASGAAARLADPDLAVWLVGVHHGRGRPMMPPVRDDAAGTVEVEIDGGRAACDVRHGLERLDAGWVERHVRLHRRYGAWGLAHLEAVLRLADHRQSEEEAR